MMPELRHGTIFTRNDLSFSIITFLIRFPGGNDPMSLFSKITIVDHDLNPESTVVWKNRKNLIFFNFEGRSEIMIYNEITGE